MEVVNLAGIAVIFVSQNELHTAYKINKNILFAHETELEMRVDVLMHSGVRFSHGTLTYELE